MSNQDKKTISNQPHEVKAAADFLKVPVIVIHLAKHETQSNNREVIYEWVKNNKGSSVGVII